jgi:hypothetical protein
MFWPRIPTTASRLTMPDARPVSGTPVGRIVVTLILPWVSTRSES